MSPHGALLVIGSGPGVGSHVAAAFAQQGFHKVILMSRDIQRLSDDAIIFKSVAPRTVVDIISVDLTVAERVEGALEEAQRLLTAMPPECIFLSAARSGLSNLLVGLWKTFDGTWR